MAPSSPVYGPYTLVQSIDWTNRAFLSMTHLIGRTESTGANVSGLVVSALYLSRAKLSKELATLWNIAAQIDFIRTAEIDAEVEQAQAKRARLV